MTPYYIQAFKQFSGAAESDFLVKKEGWGVYFKWGDKTYVVRHYDDLRKDYKYYFEERRYGEIYTQTSHLLWHYLLEEEVDISEKDFIVELYRQWRMFWDDRKSNHFSDDAWKETLRTRSFQDFQVFIELYKQDPGNAVIIAGNISDVELIPLIALLISEQYEGIDEFLDITMEFLIERGDELLAMEDVFEVVEVQTPGRENGTYCIYNDTLDYDFLMEEEQEKKNKKKPAAPSPKRKTPTKKASKS